MDESDQWLANGGDEVPRPTRMTRPARQLIPVLLVVLTGFGLRLSWLLHARPIPVSDFNDYRTLALGILDHGQFGYPEPTAFFLPVHPTFLAIFAMVSRSDFWLGFSMVLVGTASIGLVYLAGTRVLGSHRGGLIAAGIFAILPTFVLYSPVLATEHLLVALMVAGIYTLTGPRPWRTRNLAVSGVLLGLAVLTRGEAVFYVPAVLVWVWLDGPRPTAKRLRAVAVVVATVFLVVIPWYARNALVVGPEAGLSSSAGLNFYFAHNDSGNYGDFIEGNPLYGLRPEEASARGWKLGWEHISGHPLNLVKDIRVGTLRLFAAPDYAVIWSTQGADFYGDPDFYQREVRLSTGLRDLARVSTAALVTLAVASVIAIRVWPPGFAWLVVPLAISSWGLRTIVYWAMPRYAYFITVMFTFAAALTLVTLLRGVSALRVEDRTEMAGPARTPRH